MTQKSILVATAGALSLFSGPVRAEEPVAVPHVLEDGASLIPYLKGSVIAPLISDEAHTKALWSVGHPTKHDLLLTNDVDLELSLLEGGAAPLAGWKKVSFDVRALGPDSQFQVTYAEADYQRRREIIGQIIDAKRVELLDDLYGIALYGCDAPPAMSSLMPSASRAAFDGKKWSDLYNFGPASSALRATLLTHTREYLLRLNTAALVCATRQKSTSLRAADLVKSLPPELRKQQPDAVWETFFEGMLRGDTPDQVLLATAGEALTQSLLNDWQQALLDALSAWRDLKAIDKRLKEREADFALLDHLLGVAAFNEEVFQAVRGEGPYAERLQPHPLQPFTLSPEAARTSNSLQNWSFGATIYLYGTANIGDDLGLLTGGAAAAHLARAVAPEWRWGGSRTLSRGALGVEVADLAGSGDLPLHVIRLETEASLRTAFADQWFFDVGATQLLYQSAKVGEGSGFETREVVLNGTDLAATAGRSLVLRLGVMDPYTAPDHHRPPRRYFVPARGGSFFLSAKISRGNPLLPQEGLSDFLAAGGRVPGSAKGEDDRVVILGVDYTWRFQQGK